MPRGGFEPTRPFGHRLLRPARIPFRHLGAVDEAREGLPPERRSVGQANPRMTVLLPTCQKFSAKIFVASRNPALFGGLDGNRTRV